MDIKSVVVPDLDIDRTMSERYGRTLRPEQRLERRIVATLCAYMHEHGWAPAMVDYGDDIENVSDAKTTMEMVFNLDDSRVLFRRVGEPNGGHTVLLVCGNGEDIISDWSYMRDDSDRFDALMTKFIDDVLPHVEVR